MKRQDQLLESVLNYLEVEREGKELSLSLLNKLIEQHQRKVTWENISKFLDWESGHISGKYIPSIETYFQRMINHGFGGTCWTIAIGFHWLLKQLGYEVSYLYMDSGHLCLRVDLEQVPYYVDLGYCAPLFQAYPLMESFRVKNERETFDYQVCENVINVVRTPGPTKTLSPVPVTLEQMQPFILKSNQWETSPVLKDIMLFGYIDQVPTSITNNQLKQYLQEEKQEKVLSETELEYWIREKFKLDWSLYQQGMAIYHQRKVNDETTAKDIS